MAMYEFHDTPRGHVVGKIAAEALALCEFESVGLLSPLFVDNAVPGFKTLYTAGRDIPPVEVVEAEIGDLSDGAYLRGTRYAPRDITVGFSLESSSATDYRSKISALNSLLKGKELIIAFNDELEVIDFIANTYTGYYFKAVFAGGTEIDGGHLNGKGELLFRCVDPIKYKAPETVERFTSESQVFDAGGDLPTHPSIVFDYGAKGRLTFVNESTGATITVGTDGESSSQAVFKSNPPAASGNPTPTLSAMSDGIDYWSVAPEVTTETLAYDSSAGLCPNYDAVATARPNVSAGPGLVYDSTQATADCGWALYDVNLAEPTSYYRPEHLIFQVQGTTSGNRKSAIEIHNIKWDPTVTVRLFCGEGLQATILLPRNDKYMMSMRYIGDTVVFRIVSRTTGKSFCNRTYYVANLSAISGQYCFLQFYRALSHVPQAAEIDKSITVGKAAWYGTAGYTENDQVQIDTAAGQILVNGIQRPELGNLNNDYENFTLDGETTISWSSSSGLNPNEIELFLKYRERYI